MLEINPIKKYDAPNLPTIEAARENRELLKKLPSRWKNFFRRAAGFACAGIISFSGMAADFGLDNAELHLRANYGGSGYGPFYVVHFTEQEVQGFVRAKLEVAGLTFVDRLPGYFAEIEYYDDWSGTIGVWTAMFNLFDEEHRVGIIFNNMFSQRSIADAFEEQDITVGAFRNPSEGFFDGTHWHSERQREMWREAGSPGENFWEWWREHGDNNALQAEYEAYRTARLAAAEPEARERLITNLTSQAQRFINELIAEGILFSQDEIPVFLNGSRIRFDVPPQIVNGRTLVPMRFVFEAMGLQIHHWSEETQRIVATNDSLRKQITLQIGSTRMEVREHREVRMVELDIPPQIIDGRTLVPLRAIAEATGATVEWDAETQSVNIVN